MSDDEIRQERLPNDEPPSGEMVARGAEGEIEQGILLSFWRHRGGMLFLLDAIVVYSSFVVAYYLCFYAQFMAIKWVPVVEIESYLKGAALLSAVWVLLIWRTGGYESGLRGVGAPMLRLRSIVLSGFYALVVLMVISFMYRGLLLSRQVYLMTFVLASSIMVLVRLLFRAIDQDLAGQGVVIQRIVVVGLDDRAREFLERLHTDPMTIRVIGFVRRPAENDPDLCSGLPVLGSVDDIRSIYAKTFFDTLIVIAPVAGGEEESPGSGSIFSLLNFCEEKRIELYMLSGSYDIAVSQHEVGSLSGVPVIRLQDASLHPFYAVLKRLMDVTLSAVGIIIGMPVWLVIALLIKLTSKGPVFFVQTRIGLHGRPFRIYKFRTMVPDAEAQLKNILDVDHLAVPGFKIKDDPRVTPFGRFLRRTSLDEIPQLINVFRGEMSLVGPRPEMPDLVGRYAPDQRRRLKAKPGITGYQQVMARGIPLAAAKGVKYDLIYLKNQSFLLDLYILFKTMIVVLRGSGITH